MNHPVAPSGRQCEIKAGDYRAIIVQAGAGLRLLSHGDEMVIDGYPEHQLCDGARGQLLAPWPNRVADGRYRFAGADRQLSLTEPERHCAIHGLVRWEAWEVKIHEGDRVQLAHRLHGHPGYPHVLDLLIDYHLHADTGIEMTMTAANVGSDAAPYGLGMHPYLTAGSALIDSCQLLLPADSWLATDERGIPNGPAQPVDGTLFDFRIARPIGQTAIDFAFTDLQRDRDGLASVVLSDPSHARSRVLWVDESFRWLEIFTGDHLLSRQRQGLGVEPMTCPPNALISGQDLIVLEPGEHHIARWGIKV
jgi:aldose 1-epimerase